MNRVILITGASGDRRLKRFYSTVKNISAELQVLDYRPHYGKGNKIEKSYPGHISKYFDFEIEDMNAWYVFTDMYDVVFQKDFPRLDDFNKEILVSSEDHLWKDSGYYRGILKHKDFKALMDKPVYCSGTFAMRGRIFKELQAFYQLMKDRHKGQLNQPLFNLFLQGYEHADCPEMFMTLHANITNGKVSEKDGVFSWNSGVTPAIVHGNGSYDKYLIWKW